MFRQRVEVCKPFATGFTYMGFRSSMDTLMSRQKLEPYKPCATGFTRKCFLYSMTPGCHLALEIEDKIGFGTKNVLTFFFPRTIISGVARRFCFCFFAHKDVFL